MGDDTCEYIAILVPEGSSLGDVTETRSVTLELGSDVSPDPSDRSVVRQIQRSDGIDSWAFRQYWDIAHIARNEGGTVERTRDLLRGCTYPTQPRDDDDAVPYTLYFRDRENGRWIPTTLTLSKPLRSQIRGWTSDFRKSHASTEPNGVIHEAMVRAVATVRDDFPAEFVQNPRKAQEVFVKTVLTNEQAVADALEKVGEQ